MKITLDDDDIEAFFGTCVPDLIVEKFVHFTIEEIFETRPDGIQLTVGEWLGAIRYHFRKALEHYGCCSECGRKAHEGSCQAKRTIH